MAPDPPAPHRLHGLMMELVRAIGMVELDRSVAGQPVSLSQVIALHELDTDVPLSQQELARRLHLEKSTVSRMAADMERNGLLVRERHPDNRRLYRLRLTDRGRDLHRDLAAAFHRRYLRWTGAMTATEQDALVTGLSALVQAAREEHAAARHGADHPA